MSITASHTMSALMTAPSPIEYGIFNLPLSQPTRVYQAPLPLPKYMCPPVEYGIFNLPIESDKPPPHLDILTYPCLLDSVLHHADDATLALLLRTCRYLFTRAGKLLYRDMTLTDEVSPAILAGATFARPPSSRARKAGITAPHASPSHPALSLGHSKNALLRNVRRLTFKVDSTSKSGSGVRRVLAEDDRICLPNLEAWVVVDPVDRFLTPFDWGVQMGHSIRQLAWKGIHGSAFTNQLAGATATARIMGARAVTLVLDSLPAPPPSADIINWEAEHRSTLPCELERITIVACSPTLNKDGKDEMGRYHLKKSFNDEYDLAVIVLATIKCHELPVEVIGLEHGEGGKQGCEPCKAWKDLVTAARTGLGERHYDLLRLSTVAEWLESDDAKDVYGYDERKDMMEVARRMQPDEPAQE